VEAPDPHLPRRDERSIFLAGGITGCPDWQRTAGELMRDHEVVVLNPRRATYTPATADVLAEQIAWEYHHLQQVDYTLFWFPACDPRVTVQSITLLELGTAMADARLRGRAITVGADPNYPRRADLRLQLAHALPGLTLHDTLRGTVGAVLRALSTGPRS
jgi:hypothetical protein